MAEMAGIHNIKTKRSNQSFPSPQKKNKTNKKPTTKHASLLACLYLVTQKPKYSSYWVRDKERCGRGIHHLPPKQLYSYHRFQPGIE